MIKKRLVVDYSNTINTATPLDAYPMPRIDDMITKIANNVVFSKIDLKSAYHQVELHPDDHMLTAFEAHGQLYEFSRLPFGITNAVPIFQRIMNDFIERYNLRKTFSYIDDIIIAGDSIEEHSQNLQKFQKAASQFGLTLNDSKCEYNVREITFLGYKIKDKNISPDPSRFTALLEFPTPRTIKELDRLVGFFAYYAKWIPKSSERTRILRESRIYLKENGKLPDKCLSIIKELKDSLANASLSSFDQDIQLHLETDASDNAIGATLSQSQRPIAFFSRTLQPSEKNHSTVEKEALAIVESCQRWRHLLLSGPRFIITTDQKVVSFLFDQNHTSKIKNEKISRWRIDLADFQFDIQYRPGHLNTAADALSRCSAAFDTDSLKTIHSKLSHPGVTRMSHYCKQKNLPFSIQDVRDVTGKCLICRELKPTFFKAPQGVLIDSTRPWQKLSLDFVGPMQSNSANRFLLVIIDEYSRFPFAFPCKDISSHTVITKLSSLFAIFGTPSAIHSDRGSQFESEEIRRYLLNNGIAKTRTSPYRPQGNGQCERMNGILLKTINLILKDTGKDKLNWENVLDSALNSIRTLLSTATNETPHNRLFKFPRSSVIGTDLPTFLTKQGEDIFLKNFIRAKNDPLVQRVRLIETLSPFFARIEHPNGRIDTVSTRHLAPTGNLNSAPSQGAGSEVTSSDSSIPHTNYPDQPTIVETDENNSDHDSSSPVDTTLRSRSGREIKCPRRYET